MVDFKKFLPKKDEKEDSEYFWSLLIEPGWVQSGIWKIEDNKAKVILTSSAAPWNLDDELVTASDTALSSAIQGFPEDLREPTKTVFGVSASWVDKGQISEEHLEKIKKLCSDLSLTPIGFVVLPEALAHYKKSIEGSPLNGVVLGIYKESLEISVFSMGNLLGTSQVARSVSLEDDVGEGLARFATTENIPSRFILYDGKEGELEDARQSLLKVNWDDFDKLKLLHTPKIEIIDIKTKVYALCLAGASELAAVTSLEVEEAFLDNNKMETKNEMIPIASDNFNSGKPDEIKVEPENAVNQESITDQTPEDLGFVIGKDITSDIPTPKADVEEISQEINSYHENVEPVRQGSHQLPFKQNNGLKEKIGNIKKSFLSFIPSIKIPKGPGISAGKKIFTLGPLILILIFALGFAAWWFLPKATVTIYLSPLSLGETAVISIDTKRSSSGSPQDLLTGEVVSVSVSGDKTKDTTGTKTVGERAGGEITLYRVGPELNLDSGTVINGPEGLKFTLDSDVTIASGSSLLSQGETKASVSAQDIGAQYNLAGGATFSVANYSTNELVAKNDDSFSGGSSREINAVSADDMKVLEDDLLDELSGQAKDKLLGELPKEKYFIGNSVRDSVSSKVYSAKEGDEASSLRLSMEVKVEAVLIAKEVLNEFALKYLNEKVPQGYVLREEQISYEFEFEDEADGVYEFKVRISANLLPEINKEEIAEKLKGRYVNLAEDYLNREVSGFVKAEIKIKPNLPDRLKTLPHVVKNIEIEFAAEK